ncbi:DUF853 family protein [Nakamurella flavida]|uniref:DUF853 family protein n=1 Tax=Nakamurella flavida TaxID=363630 RepID=A0A939C6I5_9ACTN|nr:helicase HerA-like domain-containing protein [Nakamurella flavida]MBM9477227.1 DUF853 family protein [Nakamurella flavida]MDP9780176.1 DNA helicase HerA-like ATPase [Nakamurella flavida]
MSEQGTSAPSGGPGESPARRIAAGYDTVAAAITLGSVVVDGVADPSALVRLPLATMNRHGLIAGATGTGKTKTLQLIAEQLSAAGVPVLAPDVKGDLSGLLTAGERGDRVTTRAAETGDDWTPTSFPVEFLSVAGAGDSVPLRATVDSFGPLLLSRVLDLNDTQESTLGLVFHFADQAGLPLLDLADLRAVIAHLTSDEGKQDLKDLGGVSRATAGVILRAVTTLAAQGGDDFFGEPEFSVADLLRTAPDGRGVINLLDVTGLQTRPALYATFLMWLLAELFETLPEVGDLDRPKLVFLFDEAHLLFTDASKAFRQSIEQTVKLIRSKGVGVFFCTQLPTDVPAPVLSQLGARIQHALRAFTPQDQKALAATVRTYPTTDDYDLGTALTTLGTGEAIVTVLSERGAPTPVAWTRIRPPRSLMAPSPVADRQAALTASPLLGRYQVVLDRESAYEMLTGRLAHAGDAAAPAGGTAPPPTSTPTPTGTSAPAWPDLTPPDNPYLGSPEPSPPASSGPSTAERLGDLISSPVVSSFMRSFGSAIGGALGRSVTGTRRRRRR